MNKIKILKKVLKNLWNSNKYKEEYIQFLIGGYDEKEFNEIAENFAKSFDQEVTKEEVEFIQDVLSTKLEWDDIQELFNTNEIII